MMPTIPRITPILLSLFLSSFLFSKIFALVPTVHMVTSGGSDSPSTISHPNVAKTTVVFKTPLGSLSKIAPLKTFWDAKVGTGVAFMGVPLDDAGVTYSENGSLVSTQMKQQGRQTALPLFINFQKTFVANQPFVYAFSLGASFYREYLSSNGVGNLEAGQNNTPPYNYNFTNDQEAYFIEGNWTPMAWQHFAPYLLLGVGLENSHGTVSPTANTMGGAPPNASFSQLGFALDAGVGASVMLRPAWGLDFRYVYLANVSNQSVSNFSSTGPVSFSSNAQNILFSVVYRFGVQH